LGVLVADFDFPLPPEQIAQAPPAERGTSRLLVLERATGRITHGHIGDLPAWLRVGDLLVVNDTRVYPARLLGRREPGGGRVEVFLLERLGPDRFDALVHPGQKLKPGGLVALEGDPDPDGTPSPRLYGRIEGRGVFGRARRPARASARGRARGRSENRPRHRSHRPHALAALHRAAGCRRRS
jgi:S-adenosylmethionine:tRNA ribosyltransferase-isomerase